LTSGGYTCDEAWQIQLAHKRARRAEIRALKKRLKELEARDKEMRKAPRKVLP
jgi:hypothetical protein